MDTTQVILLIAGLGGVVPALARLTRDLFKVHRLAGRDVEVMTVKFEDGTELAGHLDREDDVEQLLKALPAAEQLSVQ